MVSIELERTRKRKKMSQHQILTLDEHDPRVIAARNAEERLFACYGLEARTRFVFLPHQGIRIRVTEFGTGEPVLIVPGNTGDAFPLVPLMAELRGRRIIAVNRPGGGMSEGMDHRTIADFRKFAVETLTTVLDALELESVPVVAHSMGGHWSIWLALDRPERVTSLTLLGVPGNLISTGPPFVLRLLSVPGLNRLLFGIVILAIRRQSSETGTSVSAAMAACRYHFQQLPHYRISTLSLMERTNRLRGPRPENRINEEQLRQVQQPTQFLWGTNDPFGSSETGRHIAQLLPHAEFHAIQGAGHLPWLSNLAECGQLIRNFLANHADLATARDLSTQ
jgi:2-hydroxy-6-oxonona-2,4-dienedioate hydrolase